MLAHRRSRRCPVAACVDPPPSLTGEPLPAVVLSCRGVPGRSAGPSAPSRLLALTAARAAGVVLKGQHRQEPIRESLSSASEPTPCAAPSLSSSSPAVAPRPLPTLHLRRCREEVGGAAATPLLLALAPVLPYAPATPVQPQRSRSAGKGQRLRLPPVASRREAAAESSTPVLLALLMLPVLLVLPVVLPSRTIVAPLSLLRCYCARRETTPAAAARTTTGTAIISKHSTTTTTAPRRRHHHRRRRHRQRRHQQQPPSPPPPPQPVSAPSVASAASVAARTMVPPLLRRPCSRCLLRPSPQLPERSNAPPARLDLASVDLLTHYHQQIDHEASRLLGSPRYGVRVHAGVQAGAAHRCEG